MFVFKIVGGALASLFISTSRLSSSSSSVERDLSSAFASFNNNNYTSSGVSPLHAIASTSFVITFPPTAATATAGQYITSPSTIAVGYLFALFFSLARSFSLLQLNQHQHQHQHHHHRLLPSSLPFPLSLLSNNNNNNKESNLSIKKKAATTLAAATTAVATTTTTMTAMTEMAKIKTSKRKSTTRRQQPQEVTSTDVFSQLVQNESRPLSSIYVRGNTSNIPQNHPVIEALLERWRNDSLPGKRADGDVHKIALSIEGGGMRGCVAAGAAAAIHFLGLNNAIDVVYGSSAGSMVATYFISRQFRLLLLHTHTHTHIYIYIYNHTHTNTHTHT